jgi:predicted dehydrogenase
MGKFFSRRDFIRIGAGTVAAGAAAKVSLLEPVSLFGAAAPTDVVRFASIGTGVRGCELLRSTLSVPGTECVAIADLYDGRHIAGREVLGKDVPVTRDYRQVLDRKDVDAVIIAVMDHQHRRLVEDACAAGKDVYCEKPLSHTVEDGYAMVAAAQKGKRILQAGSQRVSSVLYRKAKEIYDSGRLGDVYSIDAHWDRNTASGAWVYPVPPNASEQTIDWNGFLAGAPKRPFDPVRFFRWRCYKDYGEGLAGDLFVHLVSGIHFVTGTNEVAKRAQASGGIYRWKDGREFPDLIQSLYDYPKFQVALRCNLNNETGEFIAFYGTKGSLVIKDATLTFTPQDTRPQPEGYSIIGWPAELRKQYLAQWGTEHPAPAALASNVDQEAESYALPPQYSDTVDHLANFFSSVRTRKEPVENGDFGNNAAIACHLANYSYFNKTVATWDAENKKIKS